jgi:hypothetical protein
VRPSGKKTRFSFLTDNVLWVKIDGLPANARKWRFAGSFALGGSTGSAI